MQLSRVSTHTTEETAEGLRPFFPGVEIGAGTGVPLSFKLESFAAGGISLIEYAMSGPTIRADSESFGFGAAQVNMVGELSIARTAVDTSMPTMIPDGSRAVITDVHVRGIQIKTEAITRFVRQDTGDDGFDLRSRHHSPMSKARGREWASAAQLAYQSLHDGSADNPLVGAALTDALIIAFLNAFPTNWSDRTAPRDGAASISLAVRRARAHIEDNFRLPITVAEIAAVARLSVRGLQYAFRRELGQTPLGYLRQVRLVNARGVLQAADPEDGQTVARAARSAGFSHPARFAAAYRDLFGELPSHSLRQR